MCSKLYPDEPGYCGCGSLSYPVGCVSHVVYVGNPIAMPACCVTGPGMMPNLACHNPTIASQPRLGHQTVGRWAISGAYS